jgi:hypothetical protein
VLRLHLSKIVDYFLLSSSAGLFLISLFTLNALAVAAAAAFTFGAMAVYKGWYIFEAKIIEGTGIVQVVGSYELGDERSAAVLREGDAFNSVAVCAFRGLSEANVDRDKFEGMIDRINTPFRLVVSVEYLDKRGLLDRLETRLRMKQMKSADISYRKSKRNRIRMETLENEIKRIQEQIRGVSEGRRALRLVYYVVVNAVSESRYGAVEAAKSALLRVISEFEAGFGVQGKQLYGNELLDFLKIDYRGMDG